MLRRIWDPLQAAIKNNDRLALATYASSYRMRAAWALSEALAELHASDERRESGFATPRRDIMEEVDLNPISTPMNAISTPFQRHFNANEPHFNAISTPFEPPTPFQRHFNPISTPFQPHFHPI